jgi:hypothetical protein
MRTLALIVGALSLAAAARAQDTTITIRPSGRGADQRLVVRQLPRDVALEVVRFFNGPGTIHFSGVTRIPASRGIEGDVAILGGPVTVAGRINGTLVVVNGDVAFERTATVRGDVIVVGGSVEGAAEADIHGEVRSYRDPLRYRRQGEEIVYAPQRDVRPRWMRGRRSDWSDNRSDFLLKLGGTYNRVEGLPIVFGPRTDVRLSESMRLQAEAFGIFRTGGDFSFRNRDFGYQARAELLFGSRQSNLGVGIRGYDVVSSVEPWPLKDFESGWSAFLLHKDYRDWYRRDGGALYVALRPARTLTLTAEGRDERQASLEARDPWTIFRSDQPWRANPVIEDGQVRSGVAALRFDTRNDRSYPTSGVYLQGEYEYADFDPAGGAGRTFERLFFDARAYTRVSPGGRLSVRAAGGGALGGDSLPTQRRVSLGYPDPLPGFRFREFNCGASRDAPACDRVLVLQAEFRTHFGFDFGPDWVNDWGDSDEEYEPFHVSGPDIVVFADAGRAWMAGTAAGQIPPDRLPALRTFEADLGLGLDFGPIGFYFAKALDSAERSVTFTVRMGRRF